MNEPKQAHTVSRSATLQGHPADGLGETGALFCYAPIPILIEDWSGIKRWTDALKAWGVVNLEDYLKKNPRVIEELRALHSIVDANEATLALFEADSKEMFFAWSRKLLPASRISNFQVLQAMFDGRSSCQGERMLSTLTGKKVPIVWKCSLPRSDDEYRRLHFYAFDVTEQKQNNDRLETLRSQMARTARASMVGQLVASITHEIGQPLGAIRTTLDAAIRWLDRSEPEIEEAVTAFQYASRWTDDMSAICQRLRNFLSGAPVEAITLDCADVINSAMLLIASEANANAIKLNTEIEPGIRVHADRVQLQQVLINLLINGIHAIIASGRDHDRSTLSVRVTQHDETQTLFEVTDTGHGIEESQRDIIFHPFATTKSNGMGMGLPISKSLVEAHGGEIWIATTGEEGTRFCFTLPCPTCNLPDNRGTPKRVA
ncbi:sensor histidine kinase [Paraburkholderia sp. BCC1884]|uniref:sensor histidine kinase n=1 Tax=Paraburkholderia sp. BCC1884 TaxID=2562668 RepID=UPI001183F8C8|nr:HAMP domain-containing sensor histidine kinase [Paraburkholderia sp. BCC1884]